MVLSRIILLTVFNFIAAALAQAPKPDEKDWNIADYFKNLPKKHYYKRRLCGIPV